MGHRKKDGTRAGNASGNAGQLEKFKEAARDLGCDDNEEAVDELMKRVASSPPPRKGEGSDKRGKAEKAKPTQSAKPRGR